MATLQYEPQCGAALQILFLFTESIVFPASKSLKSCIKHTDGILWPGGPRVL